MTKRNIFDYTRTDLDYWLGYETHRDGDEWNFRLLDAVMFQDGSRHIPEEVFDALSVEGWFRRDAHGRCLAEHMVVHGEDTLLARFLFPKMTVADLLKPDDIDDSYFEFLCRHYDPETDKDFLDKFPARILENIPRPKWFASRLGLEYSPIYVLASRHGAFDIVPEKIIRSLSVHDWLSPSLILHQCLFIKAILNRNEHRIPENMFLTICVESNHIAQNLFGGLPMQLALERQNKWGAFFAHTHWLENPEKLRQVWKNIDTRFKTDDNIKLYKRALQKTFLKRVTTKKKFDF